MSIIAVKEGRLVVVINDLDFEIKDVMFEARSSTNMAPLIKLQIGP
jgi:hypothetical protein